MSAWEAVGRSDDWYTPAYIFKALGVTFDLDPANGAVGGAHVPCRESYGSDGLARPWHGFVWLNPPFGGRNGIAPWLRKFIEHGNGIALSPDRTSAPWFQEAAARMDGLLFLSPKVKFERPDGSIGKSPGCGTVLMAKGQRAVRALNRATPLGLLVMPCWRLSTDEAAG